MWPTVSQTMGDFLREGQLSEEKLLFAKGIIADAATAYATASATATASAYDSTTASAYATSYASATAYASAYATASAYAASASAYAASASAYAASASAYAYAYDSTTAYAYASLTLTTKVASATSVAEAAEATEALEASNKAVTEMANNARKAGVTAASQVNIDWAQQIKEELLPFAKAVAVFKSKEESFVIAPTAPDPEREALRQKTTLEEKAKLAEIKALAAKPCADTWGTKRDRANEIMKMTREKFGSPVSPAMKAFMAHPTSEMLATAHPYSSRMSAEEAAEAAEAADNAEVFAKTAETIAANAKKNGVVQATQESCDWSAKITREIADFARAVAAFKSRL